MSALLEAIAIIKPRESGRVLSREATRYFAVWFSAVSVVLYGGGTIAMMMFASPAFRIACFTGMGLCTVTSLLSFFLTESAMDKSNDEFLGIALGSIFVRLFTLVFAFAFGQFILRLNPFGMVTGMFGTYFSYLVVEISYFHKKQLVRGQ